jgi:hypothetical protein
MSRQEQEQHQEQGTGSILKRPDPEGETSSPRHRQPHPRYGDVTFKDQVREELLSASLATAAAAGGGGGGGRAATAAHDIPMVSAVAVSQSQISAEAEEDRLHDAERRVAAAEAAAEAVRKQVAQLQQKLAAVRAPPQAPFRRSGNHHYGTDIGDFNEHDGYDDDREVRLAHLEREMAAVRPPPPALPLSNRHNRYDDVDVIVDEEDWTQQQRQQQVVDTINANTKVGDIVNENNNNSGVSSPKKVSQRHRRCIVVVTVAVAVAVLIAAATVAGISPPLGPHGHDVLGLGGN